LHADSSADGWLEPAPDRDQYSIVKRIQSVRVRNEAEVRVPRTLTRISPEAEM
jgi:hypothetical protein